MGLLATASFAIFFLASLAVGVRLLLLARRTRQLPELALAIGFLVGGVLGYGLLAAVTADLTPAGVLGDVAVYLGSASLRLGALMVAFFTWRVFRPDEAWAKGWFTLLCALAVAGLVTRVAVGPVKHTQDSALLFWTANLLTTGCYTWGTIESVRFHRVLRRRERLGLGDPAVATRVMLWAIGTGCPALVTLLSYLAWFRGEDPLRSPFQSVSYLLIATSAVAAWLAFFPLRHRGRSADTAPGASG